MTSNWSAHIALVAYANGEKRYILAPEGLKVGATIVASNQATTNDFLVGNNFPLELIPPSTKVHAVELIPGRGAQIARSAGTALELIAVGRTAPRSCACPPASSGSSIPGAAPPSARQGNADHGN